MNYATSTLLLSAFVLIRPVGYAQGTAPAVEVTGAIAQKLTLTAAELAKLPRATFKREGDDGAYEGVWLYDVLKKAGAPMGDRLRGKALVSYVLAEAKDGYQALFSLAELDPSFTGGKVLLADSMGGKRLEPDQGPFRLVVTTDKPGARSVRMLTRIVVVQLAK